MLNNEAGHITEKTPGSSIQKDRNIAIDILKGIAIFLMLWGHTIQYSAQGSFDFFEDPVFKVIYSFHMPLLALISGYLFFSSQEKRTAYEMLKRQITSLGYPIISGAVLYCVVFDLYSAIINGNANSFISNPWYLHLTDYWFLWSILAASLIIGIIQKYIKNNTLFICAVVFAMSLVMFFPNYDLNLYMYPYFAAGFCYAKYKDKLQDFFNVLKYISIAVFPVMLIFYQKEYYIYISPVIPSGTGNGFWNQISIDLYRYAIGFFGCLFVIYIVLLLVRTKRLQKIKNTFAYIGRYTLQIYIFQQFFQSLLYNNLYRHLINHIFNSNVLAGNMLLFDILYTPVIAACFAIIFILIFRALYRLKIGKLIFGR